MLETLAGYVGCSVAFSGDTARSIYAG